jgi:hypothetical protein
MVVCLVSRFLAGGRDLPVTFLRHPTVQPLQHPRWRNLGRG